MMPAPQPCAARPSYLLGPPAGFSRLCAEAEMRDAALADRFAGLGLTERDEIVRAWRTDKDHVVAFAEANLQPKGSKIEAFRALEVGHVQIDVIQSQRLHHQV